MDKTCCCCISFYTTKPWHAGDASCSGLHCLKFHPLPNNPQKEIAYRNNCDDWSPVWFIRMILWLKILGNKLTERLKGKSK